MLLAGWRRALVAFGAGLVATLALAPVNVPAVGFLSFPLLVWLIDGASGEPGHGLMRRSLPAFRVGWCFGFGYFLGGLWWLGSAMLVDGEDFLWALPLAVVGLPAILALYHGLAAAVARLLWSDGPARLLALAAAFAGFEALRGALLTGFPWNEIGVMAAPVPLLMGSVALVGLHGLTLAAIFVFSLPALAVGARRGRGVALGLGLVLVAGHVGIGAWRLSAAPAGTQPGVELRIVQPNILQSQKWDAAEAERIFARLLDLTAAPWAGPVPDAPAGEPPRRLVVWPESSFPFVLTDRPDAVARLAETLKPGETLLAGATRVEAGSGEPRFYNSVYVIGEDGAVEGAGDKLHLVPFGEYLPFQALLESWGIRQLTELPGGFSAGAARRVMAAGEGGLRFLPLVCYEIIFGDEIDAAGERPDFILNVTNDAWYGLTPGPSQHLRQAQLTAVAFGLPLVRAANTGISVVADAAGRPVAGLALGEGGTVDAALPLAGPPTPFVRYANRPFLAALLLAAIIAGAAAISLSRRD
ncbi:apolipoprotein N-acyltransferase [Aureimonas pseudogalii]|uniref:Apolipoprotein N-acyltransferase n=1 Tax=Aureimonas pseudogalii TaxID=1744844 RepID=A0A7W6EFN8_9HYPH|nr:apolipoprotein N-acyltransferase [Aureimonas pseudogalii]MBB3997800.1 apolipoprotein N-acyltransferase [Aureimonas pseudogalii]